MQASGKGSSKAESTSTPGGKKGKGAKQSKRKATDELWNEGNVPERVNPLHPFLVEKLPRMSPSTYATTLNSPPKQDHKTKSSRTSSWVKEIEFHANKMNP